MLLETDGQIGESAEDAALRWKWRWECAWRARGFIIERNCYWKNRRRWPKNLKEWKRVARKLGLSVENLSHGQLNMRGRLVHDIIQVRKDDTGIMALVVAHEVVEAVLRQEGALPPICYPWEPGADEMHIVASIVERWEEYGKLGRIISSD